MTHLALDARTATPHFPGIGRYVSNLARAIAPLLMAGERLSVIHDPAHPVALPPSSAIQAIDLAVSPFSIAQQWAVPRLLRRLNADLYHSAYIAMPYLPGIPALLTVYDLIPLRYPSYSTARARIFARGVTRLALRRARHIVTISEFTRRDFMAEFGLPPDRITAIPLAPDPAFQPQPPAEIAAIRRKYALPDRFVLYLGSNKPHKNLVRLVKAWEAASCTTQISDCSLVIAGAWDSRYPEAQRLAAGLDSIRWLGPAPEADLPALYSAAHVFAFPSLYEGFGLPVLEAMACGTPVICSNSSSLPEVVTAGATLTPQALEISETSKARQAAALLIDPLDTEALAEAICRVLMTPGVRDELRERGLARAGEFTWAQTAAATLALYRKSLP